MKNNFFNIKKTLSIDWEMRILNSFKFQIFSLYLIYRSFRINLKKVNASLLSDSRNFL